MSSTAPTADPHRSGAVTGNGATPERFSLAWLKGQLGGTLLPPLIAGAAAIALIAALLLWAGAPEYRVLFSNLAEADGGRIIAELDTRKIPYRIGENGRAILVPADQVHVLRLQLAEQGLPQGGTVGLELMDNQAFGISQFAEQVHYQRGLEGELARSIMSLGPVADARVHLALPKPTVFIRDRDPAKASVVVTLHPGRSLSDGQVASIMHLVSSSVPDLAVDQVTLVDQNGALLSRSRDNLHDLDNAHLNYIRDVERDYQQRVEHILLPLFGPHNVRVQVAAQIDFSRREETAERYGPNQSPELAAVRSSQHSTSYNGSEDVARGIPGALSNSVPGHVPSPINAADGEPATTLNDARADARSDRVINYEVDRNITHIQHQRGQIQRLSVAVVVNYRDGVDDTGAAVRLPLDAEELDQVKRLARQAMGFSPARGDELEVVNSPFTTDFAPAQPATDWRSDPATLALAASFGRYLLVALCALCLYLLILRPLLRRHLSRPAAAARTADAVAPGAPLRAYSEDPSATHEDDEPSIIGKSRRRRRKVSSQEQSLEELRETARDDPRLLAIVIRNWMSKHD